jgi:hypothetical protein
MIKKFFIGLIEVVGFLMMMILNLISWALWLLVPITIVWYFIR